MRSQFALVPVLLLSLAGASCSKKSASPGEEAIKPFQGQWQFLEANNHGKERVVVFEKDRFQINEMNHTGPENLNIEIRLLDQGTFRVDLSATPAHIDFVSLEGENQGKTRPGIFVFEGEKLKLCLAALGATRPVEFVASDNTTVMVLERKKSMVRGERRQESPP
jgi:uncharacterized protein (TIGR03067 family)